MQKIQNEVIPSVLSQIRPKLNEFFDDAIGKIINTISHAFAQKIAQKEEEIQNAQKEKEQAMSEVESKISALENTRDEIRALSKNI